MPSPVPPADGRGRPPLPPRKSSTDTRRTPSRPGRRQSSSDGRRPTVQQPMAQRPAPPSTRGTPPPLPQRSSPSVFSGRQGSTFSLQPSMASPPPQDLELFAHHCKLFYFTPNPPEESANFISATLAGLPPQHRAAYTRVQSTLRSEAHVHHLRVRISSFHALLASTTANGSLSLPARSDLSGTRARSERADRLKHFAQTWGSSAGGPLLPFFRGLWAVLRVQSRAKGGAGEKRVVWEVDDAVFLESGGPEFMHEAVAVIKGVLGFDDQALTTPPKLRRVEENRTRAGSDPFTDLPSRPKAARGPAPPLPLPRGSRRPSALSQSTSQDDVPLLAPSSPLPSPAPPSPEASPSDRDLLLPRPSPQPSGLASRTSLAPSPSRASSISETSVDLAAEEADMNRPRFRLWTFPEHIADDEAEALLALFPRAVSREHSGRTVNPRIPPPKTAGEKDLELGLGAGWTTLSVDGVEVKIPRLETEEAAGVLRCGTGRMWVGEKSRRAGWAGGGWFRFVRWWKRLFGLG